MVAPRVILCAIFFGGAAAAQRSPLPPDRWEGVRGVLDAVYRMDYPAAEALARRMISRWPDDPTGYVYLARVFWQQAMFDERALTLQNLSQPDFLGGPRYRESAAPASAQRFRAAGAEAVARARSFAAAHPRDPAALYLLGVAYANEASYQIAINNAWLAAVRIGNRSYQAHRALLALDPDYADARLTTGIYNYVAGSLPWTIKWIAVLLGYSGSAQKGKDELETAASRGEIAADDARTILALLYSYEKRYDLAIRNLAELRRKYPDNHLASLELAGLHVRRGDPAAAVAVCRETLARLESEDGARIEKEVVYNHLALAYRGMKDLAQAEKWLRLAAANPASSPRSKVASLMELGKTLDLAGRRSEALEQYRAIRQLPNFANSHRAAAQYLNHPFSGEFR